MGHFEATEYPNNGINAIDSKGKFVTKSTFKIAFKLHHKYVYVVLDVRILGELAQ